MQTFLRKYYLYIYCFAAIWIASLYAFQIPGDFHIFLQASSDLLQGKNVYDTLYNQWYHYYYGLSFAILLYPLTLIPIQLAAFVWLIFNFYFLYCIGRRIIFWLNINNNTHQRLVLIILLFCIQFLLQNLRYGQMTIFILYSVFEFLQALQEKKTGKASLFLAAGIHIKILPVVFIPWLMYRAQWKTLSVTLLALFTFYLFPYFIIGENAYKSNLISWYHLINPSNEKHILDTDESSFHSLTTLLATLFVEKVPDTYALTLKRNIANITIDNLLILTTLTRLLFISTVLLVFRAKPFYKNKNRIDDFNEVSFILCLIPLIFPHQQHYAFLLCWPAATLLIMNEWKKNESLKFTGILLIVIFLSFNLTFILGQFKAYYEHYKIISYAAILLIVLFIIKSRSFYVSQTK
jgi:hypothetical protein